MTQISNTDWDHVHELACEIANAITRSDDVVADSRTEALMEWLETLERKYGQCSKITATKADYAEETMRMELYEKALNQARTEGDTENEKLIVESMMEMRNES